MLQSVGFKESDRTQQLNNNDNSNSYAAIGSELRFQNNKESANGKFINLHCVELWTTDVMNSIWFLLDQWSPTFWHQEQISGKTIFPQTREVGEVFKDDALKSHAHV